MENSKAKENLISVERISVTHTKFNLSKKREKTEDRYFKREETIQQVN